jgi:hypothetical protein
MPSSAGGIASLGVMAVARKDNKGKKNKHPLPGSWDSDLKGDIVLFRVDDDGACAPFTAKEHKKWVSEGMPDAVEEAEEEEDDMSDEEGSSDDEEENLEAFADRLKELPVAELRKACKILGLSDKGGKSVLLEQLYAHAQQNAEDDDDDEAEEEEGAQKNDGELPPKAVQGKQSKVHAKGKASPAPHKLAPAKKIAKTPTTVAKARRAPAKSRR